MEEGAQRWNYFTSMHWTGRQAVSESTLRLQFQASHLFTETLCKSWTLKLHCFSVFCEKTFLEHALAAPVKSDRIVADWFMYQRSEYEVCPGSEPSSKCPAALLLQTREAAWVMQSGCWTVKTAKRTEWWPSNRLMCFGASVEDLRPMKAYLIFYCFQEEPKISLFSSLFTTLRYLQYYSFTFCPSRHPLSISSYPLQDPEGLEPIPADTVRAAGTTLDRSRVHSRADT